MDENKKNQTVPNVGGYSCDVTHESDFSTIASPTKQNINLLLR